MKPTVSDPVSTLPKELSKLAKKVGKEEAAKNRSKRKKVGRSAAATSKRKTVKKVAAKKLTNAQRAKQLMDAAKKVDPKNKAATSKKAKTKFVKDMDKELKRVRGKKPTPAQVRKENRRKLTQTKSGRPGYGPQKPKIPKTSAAKQVSNRIKSTAKKASKLGKRSLVGAGIAAGAAVTGDLLSRRESQKEAGTFKQKNRRGRPIKKVGTKPTTPKAATKPKTTAKKATTRKTATKAAPRQAAKGFGIDLAAGASRLKAQSKLKKATAARKKRVQRDKVLKADGRLAYAVKNSK